MEYEHTPDELISALESEGLIVVPTDGEGDYHEWEYTISWPECYAAAEREHGNLEFGKEFPCDIDDALTIDAADDGMHRPLNDHSLVDHVRDVKQWIAGQYWTFSGE